MSDLVPDKGAHHCRVDDGGRFSCGGTHACFGDLVGALVPRARAQNGRRFSPVFDDGEWLAGPQHVGAPITFWGRHSTSGVLVDVTSDLETRIEALDSAIDSLMGDIDALVARADPQSDWDAFRLQADFAGYEARWKGWLAEGYSTFNDRWALGAQDSLNVYQALYEGFRSRFINDGGTPSMADLPPPPKSIARQITAWLPWIALGVVAYLFAPALVPLIKRF